MTSQAPTPTTGTYPLRELQEFAVADGFPDPRGWAVYAADRQRVGMVADLLVDLDALVVRYLAVRLDSGASGSGSGGSTVLVPVGLASADGPQRVVLIDLPTARLTGLPPYAGAGPIARGDEDAILRGFAPASGAGVPTAGATAATFYDRPEFATARFYGGFGPAAAGGPVTSSVVGTPGNEVRIVAMREEAVVTTRRVVKEVLVIKRRRVVEEQPVEYDLRSERIDVERLAPAQP